MAGPVPVLVDGPEQGQHAAVIGTGLRQGSLGFPHSGPSLPPTFPCSTGASAVVGWMLKEQVYAQKARQNSHFELLLASLQVCQLDGVVSPATAAPLFHRKVSYLRSCPDELHPSHAGAPTLKYRQAYIQAARSSSKLFI